MDEELIELAELAVREIAEQHSASVDSESGSTYFGIHEALSVEGSAAARLKAALDDDDSFGDLRNGWIQSLSSGGLIQDHVLAANVINIVSNGTSPKRFLQRARDFAASRESVLETYTALAGINVEKTISLRTNVDLIPWSEVPDGHQKEIFRPNFSSIELIWSHRGSVADAAIRVRFPKCQVLFPSNEDAVPAREERRNELITQLDVRSDVVRCITMLHLCPVAPLGTWTQFEISVANDFVGTSYSPGEMLLSGFSPIEPAPIDIDGSSIESWFEKFEKFNHSEKPILRVALDRLNQSIRRRSIVDRAIDLGIALEIMLLHGIGEDQRGEMRFRTSIRGTAFLNGDKPNRLKNFRLLKDLYDIRSKAVHTGVLNRNHNNKTTESILQSATETCAQIAKNLIELQKFPNWDTDFVIGT